MNSVLFFFFSKTQRIFYLACSDGLSLSGGISTKKYAVECFCPKAAALKNFREAKFQS